MSRMYSYRNTSSRADGPCKNCSDRHFKCHVQCEKYNSWKQQRQTILDEQDRQRDINDAIITLSCHTHNQIRKQMNKRK